MVLGQWYNKMQECKNKYSMTEIMRDIMELNNRGKDNELNVLSVDIALALLGRCIDYVNKPKTTDEENMQDAKSNTMLQILEDDLAETNRFIASMEEAMKASNSKRSKPLDDLRYKRDILEVEINKYKLLFGGVENDSEIAN